MNRILKIALHVLVWVLILVVPFISISESIREIGGFDFVFSYVPIFTMSIFLILIFYINYFILIPRYLLRQRYLRFTMLLLLLLGSSLGISALILNQFQFSPEYIRTINPLFEKVGPIARANAFLMMIVSLIGSVALSFSDRIRQVEKERHVAQLNSLKSQIQPHFLFNTLNNLYAIAITESPTCADMIAKLSNMMRYSMDKARQESVFLDDEVEYIKSYIELQSVRLDNRVRVVTKFNVPANQYQIAPMLLMAFIENAFKHGIDGINHCEIQIALNLDQNVLQLHVANPIVERSRINFEGSGLGVRNTLSRLDLSYQGRYKYQTSKQEGKYKMHLSLEL
jgi:LytS/YehU family sensor histidine kinase